MAATTLLPRKPKLTKPGLFVTATDTDVGKTVLTCAIAWALRQQTGKRIGVCKPFASGCRRAMILLLFMVGISGRSFDWMSASLVAQ